MSSENKLIVLVLETCGPIANNLKVIIEKYYHQLEVKICANGEEIIEETKHSEIYLIISVLEKIGKMNGLELLAKIKDESPKTKFLTIAGDNCNVTEITEAGADGFVEKPYTVNILLKTINKVLN